MTAKRLERVAQHVTGLPLSAAKPLPSFDELPSFRNFPGCAWSVWGPEDQLGTVNLLTEEVVQRAASEEVKLGKTVSLNWPINFPEKPMFNRKVPEVKMIRKNENGIPRDDEIHMVGAFIC
jgi:hypothetical protein